MESCNLLLNDALSPYTVSLTPAAMQGEYLLTVRSETGLALVAREVNRAQLMDKRLLIDVVDGLHRDVRIAEGRLEPCVIAALRSAAEQKLFSSRNL